ncbi:exocyst complex component 8 [Musca vetustissima]|uniref:exocyst complex component 8 n=1 Tax=Musca vetustissima TaxID=27455 RepID=UPI002AB74B0B|nr:exocyst complex component 8 [Musca vetustissima]
MSDLIKVFDNPNFSVEKYTKQLVKECVGGPDLQKKKKEIQSYSDKTSATLKKSVYANYMQFIETAKEISNLESEMTQLSLLLHEQHNILASLTDGAVTKTGDDERDTQTQEEAENMHATRAVKEMVQGFNGNLEGKTFLCEGALTELDSNDYRPIQRVFFFLFNDVLIVCKVKHDKRLEFIAEYDPKKIAVINIKDLNGVKNAINIITPDGSKIYQSITPAGKSEWIEQFEVAFRWDQQQKKSKKGLAPQPPKAKGTSTPNSNCEKSADMSPNELESVIAKDEENVGPDWIQSASDEIQTFIAQRHFEDAEALIRRCKEFLVQNKNFVGVVEIEEKIKHLERQLADVLLQELSKCHARNLEVALRSSKRCLQILVNMGKARQASGTLLRVCSIALRTAQREARKNNAEISELFFCDLAQVACAFLVSFESQPACVSALVVWCNAELQYFASQLKKHYLTKGSHLESIAKCVEGVRKPCAKLTEIGLDLSYHLEGLLRADLEDLINESRLRLLETIGRTDDPWQPFNLHTKSNLKRLLLDLETLGIDIRPHTTGDTWINLTQSTLNFTRHYLQLTNHCSYLAKSEALSKSCQILLRDLFIAQHSLKPDINMSVDPNFVAKNKRFLCDELLPIAIANFRRISGSNPDILFNIGVTRQNAAPIPKKRSVYQTDVF